MGQGYAELLHIIYGREQRERAIYCAYRVNVYVADEVGVRNLFGKDTQDRVLALDGLGQKQAAAFGAVGLCGGLAKRAVHHSIYVIEGDAEPGVRVMRVFHTKL